eukprot:TRINITY_DN11401_c0_g1_i1.p1 TRINITY_DN11401_c0_g1~~TRINITY_DN11401_c0_g1_i1.p1  ORF type:complete len:1546 (+),score=255.10 TRINITY_DN11401_c0_g1_i1:254-4639(+)
MSPILRDTGLPNISCPTGPLSYQAAPGVSEQAAFYPEISATDNISPQDDISINCSPVSGSILVLGSHVVNCFAEDSAGNEDTCQFTVTVLDGTPPSITCPPSPSVDLLPIANSTSFDAVALVTAFDNVGVANKQCNVTDIGPALPAGTHTVRCTADDEAGLSSHCTFQLTVRDTTPPVMTCPTSTVYGTTDPGSSKGTVNFTVSAMDAVDGNISPACFLVNQDSYRVGTTEGHCRARDKAGNEGRCDVTVVIVDDEIPSIECPQSFNTTVVHGRSFGFPTWRLTFDDNNGRAKVSRDCQPSSGSPIYIGENTVECSARDDAWNQAFCTFNITVIDNDPPILSCPQSISRQIQIGKSTHPLQFMYRVDAYDNSDYVPNVTCNIRDGVSLPAGEYNISCNTSDAAMNTAACWFIYEVRDYLRPRFTACPSNIVQRTDPGRRLATINFPQPSAQDPSGQALTPECNRSSGDGFSLGSSTVTCNVRDSNNRLAQCVFTVDVFDDEAPTLSCPNDPQVNTTAGSVLADLPDIPVAGVADNSQESLTAQCRVLNGYDLHLNGDNTIVCEAEDSAGNKGNCTYQVVVSDNEAPEINCPESVSIDATYNLNEAVFTPNPAIATDNDELAAAPVCQLDTSFPIGTTLVACTVQDRSGNAAACAFNITVKDAQRPSVQCPITQSVITPNSSAIVNFTANATDLNDGALVATCSPPSGSTFSTGSTDVTCAATDQAGNQGDCSFEVFVSEYNEQALECPSDAVLTPEAGEIDAVVQYIMPNVSQGNVTCSAMPGTRLRSGAHAITCRHLVDSALLGFCVFTVTVVDVVPPVLYCPENVSGTTDPGQATSRLVFIKPAVVDNTDRLVTSECDHSDHPFPIGETAVTCEAIDSSNNTASCTFNVSIEDKERPQLSNCQSTIRATMPAEDTRMPITWDLGATDNAGLEGITSTCSTPSGSEFKAGRHEIQCSVADASGNQALCAFSIVIAQDCRYGWSDWSACSTCASTPARVRYRQPINPDCPSGSAEVCTGPVPPLFGGQACPNSQLEACGDVDQCGSVITILSLNGINIENLQLQLSRVRTLLKQTYLDLFMDFLLNPDIVVGPDNVQVEIIVSRRELGDAQARITIFAVAQDANVIKDSLENIRTSSTAMERIGTDLSTLNSPVVTNSSSITQATGQLVLPEQEPSDGSQPSDGSPEQPSSDGNNDDFPLTIVIGIAAAAVVISVAIVIFVYMRKPDDAPIVLSRTATHRAGSAPASGKTDLFERRSSRRESMRFKSEQMFENSCYDPQFKSEEEVDLYLFDEDSSSQEDVDTAGHGYLNVDGAPEDEYEDDGDHNSTRAKAASVQLGMGGNDVFESMMSDLLNANDRIQAAKMQALEKRTAELEAQVKTENRASPHTGHYYKPVADGQGGYVEYEVPSAVPPEPELYSTADDMHKALADNRYKDVNVNMGFASDSGDEVEEEVSADGFGF